jgi:hypothetical protein
MGFAAALLAALGADARASAPGAQDAPAPAEERRFAAGVSFGSPQVLGLTGEYAFRPSFRLQANVGSLVVVSTVSARLIILPESLRLQPYMFVGGGGGYVLPLENEHGFTPFSWWGFGLRLKVGRGRIFAEVGEVGNLDRDNGYSETYPGMATGILFTL